ncbi:MAG: hypothetical protein Q8O84_00165 [Nanoarchaeota archaeon]|nr:hypothetical protein [Nanoarchaeota archaeon]
MNGKLKETIQSRKFWFAIIAALIPILNQELDLNLDTTTVYGIIAALIAWILGEAQVDSAKIKNGTNGGIISANVSSSISPKNEITEKLNNSVVLLNKAIAEFNQLEKNYKEGTISLDVILAAVEAWRKKYPDLEKSIPPGYPGITI